MKNFKILLQVLLLSGIALFIQSCGDDEPVVIPTPEIVNIADIVEDTPRFSSLLAALQKTDLVATLNGTDEYTVFAPNNDAFATYLNGTPLADVDTEVLKKLLLNHVVVGKVASSALSNGYVSTAATESTSSNPISLLVNIDNGVMLNGSVAVIAADIEADNGTIHEVSSVIEIPNIVNLAMQGGLDSLVVALTQTGFTTDFVGTLSGNGPFTVFAPSNEAFATLIANNATWNSIADIDIATLEQVLLYHVTSAGNVVSSTLTNGQTVPTLQGGDLIINTTGGVSITDSNMDLRSVVVADIQGSNGIVHVIDGVLMP
jgi:transforming growth factor-beta-induced protein